jgi:hypothetical protein
MSRKATRTTASSTRPAKTLVRLLREALSCSCACRSPGFSISRLQVVLADMLWRGRRSVAGMGLCAPGRRVGCANSSAVRICFLCSKIPFTHPTGVHSRATKDSKTSRQPRSWFASLAARKRNASAQSRGIFSLRRPSPPFLEGATEWVTVAFWRKHDTGSRPEPAVPKARGDEVGHRDAVPLPVSHKVSMFRHDQVRGSVGISDDVGSPALVSPTSSSVVFSVRSTRRAA